MIFFRIRDNSNGQELVPTRHHSEIHKKPIQNTCFEFLSLLAANHVDLTYIRKRNQHENEETSSDTYVSSLFIIFLQS